ncbi:MAG: hypothetical protein GXP14_12875 [Gammaproteobacteria bacterium]|nr:hypothetical protein [Gammaproteobacteria bacterium]
MENHISNKALLKTGDGWIDFYQRFPDELARWNHFLPLTDIGQSRHFLFLKMYLKREINNPATNCEELNPKRLIVA